MPQYEMPIGETGNDFMRWNALDGFTQGYIEAALFCEANCDNPELDGASFAEIAAESVASIIADCAAFQSANESLLDEAFANDDYDSEQAGRDYWFTRNGHGVGYWDRSQLDRDDIGNRLSAACGRTEIYVYRGDDGAVYFS